MRDLIIVDMSGEWYERAINSAAEARDLEIVRRSDHFVHLIDAAKLQSKDSRTLTRSNSLKLMRRFLEEKMLQPDSRVDILLTKWDLVLLRSDKDAAAALLAEYADLFHNQCAGHVGRFRIHPVAARPHYSSDLRLGYGLDKLIQSWVEEIPRLLMPSICLPAEPLLAKGFDKFGALQSSRLFSPKQVS